MTPIAEDDPTIVLRYRFVSSHRVTAKPVPTFAHDAVMSGRISRRSAVLHVSTRGEAPALGFADALLAGLARDGGLYVPQAWPSLTADAIRGFAGLPYADVAKAVLGPPGGGDDPER